MYQVIIVDDEPRILEGIIHLYIHSFRFAQAQNVMKMFP